MSRWPTICKPLQIRVVVPAWPTGAANPLRRSRATKSQPEKTPGGETALAGGAEGGFADEEVALDARSGRLDGRRILTRILRIETAACFLVSVLAAASESRLAAARESAWSLGVIDRTTLSPSGNLGGGAVLDDKLAVESGHNCSLRRAGIQRG